MLKFTSLAVVALLLALSSCSTTEFKIYDYQEKGADFKQQISKLGNINHSYDNKLKELEIHNNKLALVNDTIVRLVD
jgi:cell division protein FtsL